MAGVANLVFTTVQTSTPLSGQLPSFVWLPFTVVHKTHRMWRQWRRAVLYTNQNNFAGLAAGHAAYLAGGANVPFIRCIAQATMICSRIFECIEQQIKIRGHCRSLIHAIKGEYLPHQKPLWLTSSKHLLVSPSTIIWWKALKHESLSRTKEIAHHSYHIITGIFQLSMLMLDAAESFSSSPETGNESIREFYCNMSKSVDGLVNNSERLLETMTKHKELIQKVLTGMNIPISFDQILTSLNKALGNAQNLNNASKTAQAKLGGLMGDLAKKGLFGFLIGIGLSEFVPNIAVTPLKPLWASKDTLNPLNRYPPHAWVTLPSKLPQSEQAQENPGVNVTEKQSFKCPDHLPISKKAQAAFNLSSPAKIAAPNPTEKSRERLVDLFNHPEIYVEA